MWMLFITLISSKVFLSMGQLFRDVSGLLRQSRGFDGIVEMAKDNSNKCCKRNASLNISNDVLLSVVVPGGVQC